MLIAAGPGARDLVKQRSNHRPPNMSCTENLGKPETLYAAQNRPSWSFECLDTVGSLLREVNLHFLHDYIGNVPALLLHQFVERSPIKELH